MEIRPSTIYIIFQSDLSLTKHISKTVQTSFFHIRQIRQIRQSLNTSSAIILANSLVTSRLDYCNSLYYNLPSSTLSRLQRVQNSLARVVCPHVKRHHHITPILRSLHWLPISKRIEFKIATLTFNVLLHHQPSYLHQLIIPCSSAYTTRSVNKHLLQMPFIRSSNGRRSFFFAAPTIWNSLPLHIRSLQSISSFRSALKHYLFPP